MSVLAPLQARTAQRRSVDSQARWTISAVTSGKTSQTPTPTDAPVTRTLLLHLPGPTASSSLVQRLRAHPPIHPDAGQVRCLMTMMKRMQ
ncbi:hypothetical protein JOB18_030433 [Solea senegalensis]|uniref:Uncharacterized protein n=1 Tax=Solea senegalensis TaxID=28829 RepID=A0AAV6SG09_SOLSE|nr:hypothetical protein JOB18_030433 [Solea senegalensis]